MEINLFPASGDNRDRFRIYTNRQIQILIDDEIETERLLDENKIIDKPILHEVIRNQKRTL